MKTRKPPTSKPRSPNFDRTSRLKTLNRDVFGGKSLKNGIFGGTHAKRKRPLQNGEWLHVCLKSQIARGPLSMLRPPTKIKIERIVKRTSDACDMRISKWQNVGNHLHFSVKSPNRAAYNRWIRSLSGLVARATLQTERGSKKIKREKFWESRPFTRIIRGFEAFDRLSRYIRKNQLEALGNTSARAKEIMRMIAVKEMYLEQTAAIDLSHPPPD